MTKKKNELKNKLKSFLKKKVRFDMSTIAYFFGSIIFDSKDVIFRDILKNIWCHLLLFFFLLNHYFLKY